MTARGAFWMVLTCALVAVSYLLVGRLALSLAWGFSCAIWIDIFRSCSRDERAAEGGPGSGPHKGPDPESRSPSGPH